MLSGDLSLLLAGRLSLRWKSSKWIKRLLFPLSFVECSLKADQINQSDKFEKLLGNRDQSSSMSGESGCDLLTFDRIEREVDSAAAAFTSFYVDSGSSCS
ncbi:hypothetical protein NPIL_303531 [Nephila pilipes]|uniref:Uncharacterized protein n=1 Tax=Nephila pilipes TaxID=299642 RepID=A0A8X6UJT5_NEPPI|nr:hypothetical protein NPIL_303531 [Nephila pilipes]